MAFHMWWVVVRNSVEMSVDRQLSIFAIWPGIYQRIQKRLAVKENGHHMRQVNIPCRGTVVPFTLHSGTVMQHGYQAVDQIYNHHPCKTFGRRLISVLTQAHNPKLQTEP